MSHAEPAQIKDVGGKPGFLKIDTLKNKYAYTS